MFLTTKYILNTFSLSFPRQIDIRRKANQFEDILQGSYSPPQIFPIPDEVEPKFPRIIFESEHGFSQILISQSNINLNVNYSPDWQTNIANGKDYLLTRLDFIFNLFDNLKIEGSFIGLGTKIRIAADKDDSVILNHIAKKYFNDNNSTSVNDFLVKKTKVINDCFFSNISIGNYRHWEPNATNADIPKIPNSSAVERGVEITGDFNDRYSYNEKTDYKTSRKVAPDIIKQGFEELEQVINFIRE